ncbi:ZPR1 zinc finger domain-containing protein [Candidatus Woesearchaeota archaeon]|jgi:zinc finger protein|nr:ZPR1 zinc finger domain-containing protein [Candidatus Woesearchaeota archaeon]MBT5397075.1 ZPR1 zinc finger domain-containing protein [Candidatus Woesearchaeota archaeon]MBT6367379.1 ZPR1 zinc finger domain-containing protein [Candidatus Woesearchaeota archaeon]MBT7762475.1 ZPR1 zinc finger domain-containing protein [Candidatus Woesearchaeota archaeon]
MPEIKNQPCPFCGAKKCTLNEEEIEIPYFGRVFVFSMDCSACNTRKSDVEPVESKEPCKFTLEVSSEDDLNIKIVKSGSASIKIPHVITIESGPASEGYVTNVEGFLERIKKKIQSAGESEDDPSAKKKAKNLVKKLGKVLVGREKLKIIIEDPSGHSAIISDKAQKSKL